MLGLTAGTGLIMGIRLMASFGQEMATASAITSATTQDFNAMRDAALELGRTTRFTSTQAAEGITYLARAGFTAVEATEAIPGVLQLAQAGAIDLGSAADIASNILTGFAMQVDETSRVVDVMTLTVNSSNTNVRQLGDAMKFIAPIAATLGMSIEETAASIGILSNAGLQGTMAGTGLRGVIARLEAPSAQLQRDLRGLGVSLDEVRPSTVGLTAAMERLVAAGAQGRGLELFEQRAGPAFEVLAANIGNVREMTAELGLADGTAARVAGTMDDTLNGSLLRLNSALQGLVHSLGDQGAEGGLRGMVDALTAAFTFLSANAGAVTVVIQALTLRAMVPLVRMMYTAAIPAIGTMSTALQLLTVRGGAAIVMSRGLAVAMAFMGGPVGLVIAGVAALALGIMYLQRRVQNSRPDLEVFDAQLDEIADRQTEIRAAYNLGENIASIGEDALEASPYIQRLARELGNVSEQLVIQAMARKENFINQALTDLATLNTQRRALAADITQLEHDRIDIQARGIASAATGVFIGSGDTTEIDASIASVQRRLGDLDGNIATSTALLQQLGQVDLRTIIAQIREELDAAAGPSGTALSAAEMRYRQHIQNLQNQLQIMQLPEGVEREVLASILDAGVDPASEAAAEIGNLVRQIYALEEAEAAAEDATRGRLNTFEAQRDALQENIRLMGLSAEARETEQRVAQIAQQLLRNEITLLDTQQAELTELINLERQLSAITKERDDVISSASAPLREYTTRMIALNQAMAMHPQAADLFQREMLETRLAFLQATVEMGNGSFADSFLVELARMSEGARNMTQSVGQSMGQFAETLSKGLGDSIGRSIVYAEDLGSALQDVARSAVAQLISSLVQLGVQYVVNAAIGQAVGGAATAASVVQAKIVAAAWSNAAAMVSLATFGANSIPAAAGIASTVALSAGLSKFKDGGYTGNGGVNDIAGVVHGKEFVSDAQTTAQYRPLLEALNSGKSLDSAVRATGGGGGGMGGDVYMTFDIDVNGANKSNSEIVNEMTGRMVPKIREVVRSEIITQKRPGGSLSGG